MQDHHHTQEQTKLNVFQMFTDLFFWLFENWPKKGQPTVSAKKDTGERAKRYNL